ncbi:phosphoribosyltransferase family protein [Bacteroides fragilis]
MEAKLCFMALCGLVVLLSYVIGFWRRKAGEAAFAAARTVSTAEERNRYCRLAVMAGHREACKMFCFARSDFFEDHRPLEPFKSHGIKVAFYGYYYPSRYTDLLNDEQRAFCRSLYQFKEGENHGIEFFKTCLSALKLDDAPYHIMFMPCSDEFKYARRFKRLDWYITTHQSKLTSGLYDVDVFEPRDSLHEAKGSENRILERNYRITGDIKGKEVVIVDDVLTSGQSMIDYKEEIERCGGKVVAAIFYGKTVTLPPLLLIKAHVWGGFIVNKIKELTK